VGKVKAIKLGWSLDFFGQEYKSRKQANEWVISKKISLRWLNQKLDSKAMIPIKTTPRGGE